MTTADPRDIPEEIFDALESLFFGAVGITSFALADASVADLTLPQWRALVVIGRADGVRVGEVARRIGLSLPSTSRLIGRLERRGYVSTERDDRDRRAILVRLSPSGHAVRQAVIERRRELMHHALSPYAGRLPRDLSKGLATLGRAFDGYER